MNPLIAALATLLDHADATILTRGAKAWKFNDADLPVEVGVVYVRKVLNDLVAEAKHPIQFVEDEGAAPKA